MKVPLVWLRDFVEIKVSPDELVQRLQEAGIPVEGIEMPPEVTNVVAGRILALDRHPQADKLKVASVDAGGNPLPVVTAATNVKEGDVVPVALEGAHLANGMHIQATQLRGVLSRGMMCSCEELGLDPRSLPQQMREGILILPDDYPPGLDVVEELGLNQPVLEIEAFANRPDLLSIVGVARETAAALDARRFDARHDLAEQDSDASEMINIDIESLELCPRYVARYLEDVTVGPAPLWMVIRLLRAGVRSVNNIVDITNYVMIETGQPLHAFDCDLLEGSRIVVRPAREGETITTIDAGERALRTSMLVIADGVKPVAVAGVMGGLHSEVSGKTRRVLIESAAFHPASVRRTSQALGLRSESSRRFEKGADYARVELGSRRAARLMLETGAKLFRGSVDVGILPPEPRTIVVRPSRVNRLLGTSLDMEQMERLLESVGFSVEIERTDRSEISGEPTGNFIVEVPTWRLDVRRECDVIEEIARLYGYDRIPVSLTRGETLQGRTGAKDAFDELVRDCVSRLGFTETITYSLHSPSLFARHAIEGSWIEVKNPLSDEQRAMRLTLLPSLLEVLSHNERNRTKSAALFELTKIYTPAPTFPKERTVLGLALLGETPWGKADFFVLKGLLQALLREMKVGAEFEAQRYPSLHPGRSARISAAGHHLGILGVVHPDIVQMWDLPGEIPFAEIDLDVLFSLKGKTGYRQVPRYPGVERDIAMVLESSIPASSMERILRREGKPILAEYRCFDEYRGDQIPEGQKSLAWSLTFQAPDRTLTDGEVDEALKRIIDTLGAQLGAKLRA